MIRALLMLALLIVPVFAMEPGEALSDPALEARAREISKELRCLVCQNESIDDSAAPLAADLRRVVRERLLAGDTDEEVLDFIVARYGDYVLLRPRLTPMTWLLWFGPFLAALAGCAAIVWFLRRRAAGAPPAPLTAEEEARLRDLAGS